MFRKLTLALVATAAVGTAALAPSSAEATWRGYGHYGKYYGGGYGKYYGGGYGYYGPRYYAYGPGYYHKRYFYGPRFSYGKYGYGNYGYGWKGYRYY